MTAGIVTSTSPTRERPIADRHQESVAWPSRLVALARHPGLAAVTSSSLVAMGPRSRCAATPAPATKRPTARSGTP